MGSKAEADQYMVETMRKRTTVMTSMMLTGLDTDVPKLLDFDFDRVY